MKNYWIQWITELYDEIQDMEINDVINGYLDEELINEPEAKLNNKPEAKLYGKKMKSKRNTHYRKLDWGLGV